MNEREFGHFISERRKEKGWTQLVLAEKIHVTDKAISKWERGAGLPDIKLLEPLAAALDLSLTELMASKKNSETVNDDFMEDAIQNTLEVAVLQNEIQTRNVLLVISLIAIVIITIFLLDIENGTGTFLFVCLPILLSLLGAGLIYVGVQRKRKKYKYRGLSILGIILFLFPIEVYILVWLAILITLS